MMLPYLLIGLSSSAVVVAVENPDVVQFTLHIERERTSDLFITRQVSVTVER